MSTDRPDVETLAKMIEPIIDYAGDLPWSESRGPRARNVASTVLSSDWLADRLARARAEAERERDRAERQADIQAEGRIAAEQELAALYRAERAAGARALREAAERVGEVLQRVGDRMDDHAYDELSHTLGGLNDRADALEGGEDRG